jgi:hypothetical protein
MTLGSHEVTINVEFMFDVISMNDEDALEEAMSDLESHLADWNIPDHNILSAEVTGRPIFALDR